ncbi:MAG: response regulator [Candidatus Paceibacterota bacterium]|jgi:CheY-like chemotaxis protein
MDENKKIKIMIVDDDSFLLDMYALKFSQSGYEVHSMLGAEFALEKIKAGLDPDVILLDIIMPKMDGFEFLEYINKEKLATNAVKVILSNRGAQSDFTRGEELGASGYITKASTTPSEVVLKVKEIVEDKK